MSPPVLDFLAKERVCSLAVILSDGSPHSAAVHYSHQAEPLKIFIQTSNTTTKAQPFLNGETGKASVAVGFSEQDWLTLQMRGTIRTISDPKELDEVYSIHYKKHPDAEQYKGPNTVFLEFTPTWWRYTDFNTEPETIIEK
jgi:general stress protein 26